MALRARARSYDLKVAGLDALRELHAWMRQEKILYARCGELELRLEPEVPAPLPVDIESAEDVERRDLEDLLHSSGVPVDAFMQMSKRAA